VIIRDAKQDDIGKIVELANTTDAFYTSDKVVLFWPEDILRGCIDKDDVIIKLAEDDESIVGFMIVNVNNSLKKAELENMFVLPEYRRRGVARMILDAIVANLKPEIENIVALTEDAVLFLENYGFEKGKQFYWMDLVLSDRFKRKEDL
jgi:N-acetylglutamate synthase-like GNAT family acetyltransferase